jgi:transmembrane sensor
MQVRFFILTVIPLFLGISIFSAPTHYKTERKEQLTEKLGDDSVIKLNSEKGAEIRVIGTQFNVKSRNQRVEVAVKEGRVEVSSMFAKQGNIVILTERQSISFSKGEVPNESQKIQKIALEYYFAWIYGKIGFNETSLEYAVKEVERRFDITIQLAGTVDETKAITGLFEANDVDNVLTAICQSLHINYYEVENGVYKIY